MLTDLLINLKILIETVDARMNFGRGDTAVLYNTHVGVGGPVCVGLDVGWGRGKIMRVSAVCVFQSALVPGLLCGIVENPPQQFPVGLHYQASLIDQLFPPTSCLSSSPSTPLPLPHSSQSHESPLPRKETKGWQQL